MASWTNTSHSHDEKRPQLPPIRDLFHDLRTPHDSPSLTLARLRVSDDYDDTGHSFARPSSSQSVFRPFPRSQTPHIQHHETYQAHQNLRDPPFSKPYCPTTSLGSFEPISTNSSHPYEIHHPRTRHSLPPAQEPISSSSSNVLRRHSSLNAFVGSSVYIPSEEERTPIARYPSRAYDPQNQIPRHPAWVGDISTANLSMGGVAEDQRTPVARFSGNPKFLPSFKAAEDSNSGVTTSKYECSYCGKGFNRPSSLKIHLNSHTGAKPFVCPVQTCGRSFSVLSNMRRHARVHTQTPLQTDPSSDEDSSEQASSFAGSAPPSVTFSHSRRSSTASVSSSGSRRSHVSDDDDDARPEKRFRAHRP